MVSNIEFIDLILLLIIGSMIGSKVNSKGRVPNPPLQLYIQIALVVRPIGSDKADDYDGYRDY